MWSEIVQLNVIEDDLDILHFKYSYHSDNKRCRFKTTNTRILKRTEQQRDKCISF